MQNTLDVKRYSMRMTIFKTHKVLNFFVKFTSVPPLWRSEKSPYLEANRREDIAAGEAVEVVGGSLAPPPRSA